MPRENLTPDFVRPRPGRVKVLSADVDDLEDPDEIDEASPQTLSIPSRYLSNSSTDLESLSQSDNGDWMVIGRPLIDVPFESGTNESTLYAYSTNGYGYIAAGGIFESGQVYVFRKIASPSGGGLKEWTLHQVINSPTIADPVNGSGGSLQRNVFRERFGSDLAISSDGLSLIVGAPGSGGRPFFEDSSSFNSRGAAYFYRRSSLEDEFEYQSQLFGRTNFGAQQGTSVDIGTVSESYFVTSGSPFTTSTDLEILELFSATGHPWINDSPPLFCVTNQLLIKNLEPTSPRHELELDEELICMDHRPAKALSLYLTHLPSSGGTSQKCRRF